MIGIICLWLGLACTVGLFFGLMVSSGAKTKIGRAIGTIVVALIISGLLTAVMVEEGVHDDNAWNSGYCECGGNWRLVNVVNYRTSGNRYYYECDECFSSIYTNSKMR